MTTTEQILEPAPAQATPETQSTPSLATPVAEPRIGGINIGGNTVTQSTAHLPEAQRDLVRWLFYHAESMNWGWAELAAAVGIDTTTLYRVFNDKYRYQKGHEKAGLRVSLDGICEKIAKLKKQETINGKIENRDFVPTTVYERITWLCGRCAAHNKMGFIFGTPQIGKTTSLKEYTRLNNSGRTTYAEIPPGGVQLMVKNIAKALHVSPNTCFDKLLTDIIEGLDDSKTLILDEVQRIFTTYNKSSVMRCLDTLRYIHDQTKCGMVLSGTDVFRDETKSGEFVKYLQQFNRRGRSYILQLPTEPPRSDLDLMAAHFGLEPATGDAEHIMLHIAKVDGFGVFTMRLQDAKELATKKRETLNWAHFVRAYAITENAATVIAAQY